MNHITTARFSTGRTTTTPHLWQYDYGQLLKIEGLELPVAYEVHFANQDIHGETKTVLGNADGVMIPDEFMQTGKTVYAWIFLHDDVTDGETEYKITIPVRMRPQPTNDEPTPVQQDIITQAIAALDAAVEQTGQDVETTTQKAAEASESATRASRSEQNASDAANRAEAANTSAQGAAQRAEIAAESALADAHDADISAQRAEQAAANAGFMWLSIEGGHVIYERTDSADADFYLEDGHLYVEAV